MKRKEKKNPVGEFERTENGLKDLRKTTRPAQEAVRDIKPDSRNNRMRLKTTADWHKATRPRSPLCRAHARLSSGACEQTQCPHPVWSDILTVFHNYQSWEQVCLTSMKATLPTLLIKLYNAWTYAKAILATLLTLPVELFSNSWTLQTQLQQHVV